LGKRPSFLLEELKPTQSNLNTDINNQDSPSMKLYDSLKVDFDEYLQSEKTPHQLKEFHEGWQEKITASRNDKALMGNAQAKDIFLTIALILCVVGIIYLAVQAKGNSTKNRSLFFPSALEEKLNTLQDKEEKRPEGDEGIKP